MALPATELLVETEINALLEVVAKSGCDFKRNGTLHSSPDAAEHLALKYSRGQRYVETTENFIIVWPLKAHGLVAHIRLSAMVLKRRAAPGFMLNFWVCAMTRSIPSPSEPNNCLYLKLCFRRVSRKSDGSSGRSCGVLNHRH